ncbi:Pentapeptide repeats (8 copies) [compost metagenome]
MKPLAHDIIAGIISGLVSGTLLSVVALTWDNNIAVRQERAEDLRFVRDVYLQGDVPAMPFQGVDLEGMSLKGLHFGCKDKELVERCLVYADFTGAKLKNANMSTMDLSWADFSGADLEGTNFSNSDLGGANFRGARNLDKANLTNTCNGATQWPEGFHAPPVQYENCIPQGF